VGGHLLFLTPFLWRFLFRPVVTILLIGNAVALYFMVRFQVVMDESMMRNVVQTDPREVRDLVNWRMLAFIVFAGVVPAVLLWSVRVRRDPWRRGLRRRGLLVLCAMAMILFATATSYKTYASFIRNNREVRFLISPQAYIASLIQLAVDHLERPAGPRIPVGANARAGPLLQKSSRPVVFVMVVGETARAAEFSLNGYSRDTNPSLRAHDVISFPRVDSCGTSTADSLPCMFSHLGRVNFLRLNGNHYESMLDVFQHAGFRVLWLDNNAGCKGVCQKVEMQSVENLTVPQFCSDGECFDEVLLMDLDKIVRKSDRNLVLILHQKGSHGPAYYRRYPASFERFTPSCRTQDLEACSRDEIRNAYDNSILYTDFFLGRVIDLLSSMQERDTAMLYVSDHGESLGENGLYLHGLPYRIAQEMQKRVPMILWMSPQFASRFQIDRPRLESIAGAIYSHDYLFHSIVGLLDVKIAEYDPNRDLFASVRKPGS
jgi:lipid A ethanolaminephosphotransferase